MKIVINSSFGGFSLSHEAMFRYAELKGYTLYPEKIGRFSFPLYQYWIVPPEEQPKKLPEPWASNPIEDRQEYNRKCDELQLDERPKDRSDPALVQTVEELGEKANGEFASLKVVEVPNDVEWRIEEYDGVEWVAEEHRTWS